MKRRHCGSLFLALMRKQKEQRSLFACRHARAHAYLDVDSPIYSKNNTMPPKRFHTSSPTICYFKPPVLSIVCLPTNTLLLEMGAWRTIKLRYCSDKEQGRTPPTHFTSDKSTSNSSRTDRACSIMQSGSGVKDPLADKCIRAPGAAALALALGDPATRRGCFLLSLNLAFQRYRVHPYHSAFPSPTQHSAGYPSTDD